MPLNGILEENTIYVSLNARPHPGEYHWGLILTDSHKRPVLHHASNLNGPWIYQERRVKPDQSLSLIVLIRVDRVQKHTSAADVIKSIPANGNPSLRTGDGFTCRIWVKDVLMALHEYGEIKLPIDINSLEASAVQYGRTYASVAEGGEGATVINNAF